MSKTIALLGSLDTKGAEYGFVKECIESPDRMLLEV